MNEGKNWLEWVVFGLGLVLTVGVLGYLVYAEFHADGAPPRLEVTLGAPERQGNRYAVQVTVRNQGEETAEDVQVGIVLREDGEERERAAVSFPFVPQGAQQEGWVTFSRNPSSPDALEVNGVSYGVP